MKSLKLGKCPHSVSKLIVGLGNPGASYDKTKHNVGKKFIDFVVKQYSLQVTTTKIGSIAYMRQKDQPKYVAFFKPECYMNVSGPPVKTILGFCGLDIPNLIVATDNLEQDFGKYRIKDGGSAMGHNGVKSIIDTHGGKKEFKRLLLGIGRPVSKEEDVVAQYVLSKFSEDEMRILNSDIFKQAFEFVNKEEKLNLK